MPLFIDIGGFDGDSAKRAMDDGYEVIVFEPNERMDMEGVRWIHAAAWNEDGIGRLYERALGDTHDMGLSLIWEKSNIDKDHYQEVKTINTGKWLTELDRDVDILKIDAEGAEYLIIESILDNFDYNRIKEWRVEDHSGYIHSDEWAKKKEEVLKRVADLNIKLQKW